MAKAHSEMRRRKLCLLHIRVFGEPDRKVVPSYNLSMVKRLPAGKASGIEKRKGSGFVVGAAMRHELSVNGSPMPEQGKAIRAADGVRRGLFGTESKLVRQA